MSGLIASLHNHTPFSDGAYTIDELCEAHLDLRDIKIEAVGISDDLFRTPTSREPADDREFERMFGNEMRSYVALVNQARQRWSGKVRILCGAEINWPLNRGMLHIIRDMIDGAGLDYIMFCFVDWAGLTMLANQARRWPCPVGLSQTRISDRFPNTSQEQVVRTLANARIFYEMNAAHMPVTDHDPWYQILPQHRVAVAVGTDTHDDLNCIKQLRWMYDYLNRNGLGEKLLRFPDRQEQALTA